MVTFTSHRLMNLLRSSLQVLNSGFISSSGAHSGKFSSYCILGKQSAEQKFQFFKRGVSHLAQENESASNTNVKFVQMKGLPFEATTTDVVNFFRPLGIEPVEVIIEMNRQGRANGFASVKFKSYDDALKSLRNHRKNMGRRYIELSLSVGQTGRPREVPQASASDFPTKSHRVILKGLPYEATTQDIEQFFAPLNIKPSRVIIRYGRFNLPSGICDCVFDSYEDAVTALKNHRAYIGRRWIDVVLATDSGDTDVKASEEGEKNY